MRQLSRDWFKELSKVHEAARNSFEGAIPGIKDQVRANIFLADYRRAPEASHANCVCQRNFAPACCRLLSGIWLFSRDKVPRVRCFSLATLC